MKEQIVSTLSGPIKGRVGSDEVLSFLGIPYAQKPIGDLRFMPPVPVEPWKEPLDCFDYGPAGPQRFEVTEGSYEEFTGKKLDGASTHDWVGSEDCLYLNIKTLNDNKQKKPVIVWIHGGANWLESSRLAVYDGTNFVKNGDCIFVSLNYRLGIFGWMDVSHIGGNEYKGSANNGLKDQLCALEWIKNNIANFGGDPDNITVMGESAGSIDLSWLLTNGKLNGIAKRVVLMSGIAGLIGLSGDEQKDFSYDYSVQVSKNLLEKMSVNNFDDLKQKSTDELMAQLVKVSNQEDVLFYMDSIFWPRIDGEFMTIDPFNGARKNGSHGIDVLIGYTAYEMGLWLFWDENLDTKDFPWVMQNIKYSEKTEPLSEIAALYKRVFPSETEGVQVMHMLGDSAFVVPSYIFADLLCAKGENVRIYQFDWMQNDKQRALHAADQVFMFGNMEVHAASHLIGNPRDQKDEQERKALSDMMLGYIVNYSQSLDIGSLSYKNFEWPLYDKENRKVMSFSNQSTILTDPIKDRREWWAHNIYNHLSDNM